MEAKWLKSRVNGKLDKYEFTLNTTSSDVSVYETIFSKLKFKRKAVVRERWNFISIYFNKTGTVSE